MFSHFEIGFIDYSEDNKNKLLNFVILGEFNDYSLLILGKIKYLNSLKVKEKFELAYFIKTLHKENYLS